MKTDQRGLLTEEEEETSCKITEFFVDKVKSTMHFQHANHKESSSIAIMDLHTAEPKTSKNENGEKLKQRKEPEYYGSSSNPKAKISLIGIRRQKNGRYAAEITDRITHKKLWLGTFDTVEEASQAYFSKKSEFEKLSQGRNKEDRSKKNCNPNGTAHIIGVQKRKNLDKYISKITNPISKKRIWLGTFGTAEEASQAYQSKKLEFQKLVDARRQWSYKHTHSTQDENSGYENVNCELESAGGSENVQRIDSHEIGTAEEGFRVYHSKKKQASYAFNSGLMANVYGAESSEECNTTTRCDPEVERSLIGIRRRNSGRYDARITDQIKHKRVCLGTFDTVEEASQAYFSKMSEFEKLRELGNKENKPKKKSDQIQHESPVVETLNASSMGQRERGIDSQGKEPVSTKETSSDECNTTMCCDPKAKKSLVGIIRRKSGRYAAVITDRIRHKRVWLGTFDTAKEASQAYFSKKSEFEKLSKQENKPMENLDQIQQPESPIVETLNTFSMGRRNTRIDSQMKEPGSSKSTSCLMTNVHGTESSDECNTTTHSDPKAKISLIGIRRRKSGRYGAAITDRIRHKEVWLGTFDTAEEASQAYFSKKSEFEKLSQQGKKENKPKKIFDQIQQPESSPVAASLSVANDQTLDTASLGSRRKKRNDSQKTTHMVGACKRKMSGKCVSEIRNPISKKRIWLGTFDTAEEASQAYQSKKLEFQKLVKAKQQQCTNKQIHSKQDGKSENLVNVKHEHENITCELKSAGESAQLDVPLSNPSNGGTTVQSIDSYQTNKFDLPNSKKVKLQSIMPTVSSVGEKQEAQEDDGDLWMGQWIQLPGDDRKVMFSLKLGVPIIDNYGYLLGEFSSLDDLSIS